MPNTVKPTGKMLADMQRFAIESYPHEACGFVISQPGNKMKVVRCENIAEDPRHYFVMNPEDMIKAEALGEPVAVWHTHVEMKNTASEADMAGCEATELPWFILAIRKADEAIEEVSWHFSDLNVITPSGFEMPYLERPYVYGVFDCWNLCRDYLRREYGIKTDLLPQCRIPQWWTTGVDLLGQHYEGQGFVRLPEGAEPKVGDLFFMQFSAKVPNHCAIYIGDDMILHHQQDRLSCRAIYGGSLSKHTTHHLRHKDLM